MWGINFFFFQIKLDLPINYRAVGDILPKQDSWNYDDTELSRRKCMPVSNLDLSPNKLYCQIAPFPMVAKKQGLTVHVLAILLTHYSIIMPFDAFEIMYLTIVWKMEHSLFWSKSSIFHNIFKSIQNFFVVGDLNFTLNFLEFFQCCLKIGNDVMT